MGENVYIQLITCYSLFSPVIHLYLPCQTKHTHHMHRIVYTHTGKNKSAGSIYIIIFYFSDVSVNACGHLMQQTR